MWDVISAISPILAPIISLILALIGKVVWNHERRVRQLEQTAVRHGRTLYGDEKDIQQNGLAQDIEIIIDRINNVESELSELVQYHKDKEDE